MLVVTSCAGKSKPNAWEGFRLSPMHHLLVFAAWDDYTPKRINAAFDLVNGVRGFKNEGWKPTANKCWPPYPPRGAG